MRAPTEIKKRAKRRRKELPPLPDTARPYWLPDDRFLLDARASAKRGQRRLDAQRIAERVAEISDWVAGGRRHCESRRALEARKRQTIWSTIYANRCHQLVRIFRTMSSLQDGGKTPLTQCEGVRKNIAQPVAGPPTSQPALASAEDQSNVIQTHSRMML
jgi:hypothetical protein